MQGETGSLRDLKRYHLEHHHGVPRTILEEKTSNQSETKDIVEGGDAAANDNGNHGSDSSRTLPTVVTTDASIDAEDEEADGSDHMMRLREFQVKLLAASNTAYNSRSRSGRRHTLCLTR